MRSFAEIGRSTGTDKVTHHGYHRFYPRFLEPLRGQQITMLEIGIHKHQSLQLWAEYFPHARIYGIEIGEGFTHERGEVFQGDQSDPAVLARVIERIGEPIDFIIDDGSHVPEHQLQTFIKLFDALKDGGVYIIEDIESSYWRHGIIYGYTVEKGYRHPGSIVEIFKAMADRVNEEFLKEKDIPSPIPLEVQERIGMVSFQYNSIIIVKKDAEYIPYNNRQYRFSHVL